PVSTTHAVVGGVLGAGIVAAGVGSVSWPMIGAIMASWVISPLMGGVFAAAVLAFIKWRIMYVPDRIAAARVWVPVLIGLMAAAFAAYLALKGLSRVAAV
ncbi:MAG TPA: anion permease, partial [Citreicella sp.]|nr:anion permease [Citreicella sp.]